MKLGSIVMLHVVALVSSLAACTVHTSGDGANDRGASGGAASGAGDTTGSSAAGDAGGGASDATAEKPAANVPETVAGRSWTWVTSGGAQQLAFASDGGYTSDVFLNAHPGDACGTEYLTHREGAATFSAATLTLTPRISIRTKTDSCSGNVLAKDAIDPEVKTYGWRLEGGEGGPEALVLTGEDGHEVRYERD
jgi:hypothetical protein